MPPTEMGSNEVQLLRYVTLLLEVLLNVTKYTVIGVPYLLRAVSCSIILLCNKVFRFIRAL